MKTMKIKVLPQVAWTPEPSVQLTLKQEGEDISLVMCDEKGNQLDACYLLKIVVVEGKIEVQRYEVPEREFVTWTRKTASE